MTFPLRCLMKKSEPWMWTAACESAFLKLKSELCSDRVIIPFDPNLNLILTTDASPTGVAAVLSHEIEGVEHPIAYASRSLNPSEMNYSQLDREALAIIFGVNHFYNYLLGKKFILVTDNEPLTRIFHQNKALPQMTSARLLRYASFLSGFDYIVRFKKGSSNQNVDCLSRPPVKTCSSSTDQEIGEEVNQLYSQSLFQVSNREITSKTIKEETAKDHEMNGIVQTLKNNSTDSEYTLLDGILFRKDRIVIPTSLRSKILSELHETHLGITKMKQLARRYVYWSGIDGEIERLVKGCKSCALVKASPPKVSVHPWNLPENNWDRIHIDYAGPYENHYFLVCIDARSKWAEIEVLKEAPTSSNTINLLNKIFATHGYPKECVSDNAKIFRSEEFRAYCKINGIFQKFIAPGHPATNGLAERNVQTLKNKLKSASEEPGTLTDKVRRILFRYRATPLASNQTPAELYLNRKLRIRLDAIFPYQHPKSNIQPVLKPVRSIQEGERVQIQMYTNNRQVWQFGVIKKKLGKRHYIVTLDSGRNIKRHINQLRPTLVMKEKMVTFGPKQSFDVPRLPNQTPSYPDQIPDHIEPEPDHPTEVNIPVRSPRPIRQRRQPPWLRDFIVQK
ncbi:uncharacterized protein K02A2.6-like [Macrosteles quadrilineatus]|uniref:uncharacterized protein K02A2.6-like n=1 Tax=Macrosteles quadrilineatus TaxID=74068 RepID=UPI0023E09C69|nr:uncharacterized protein K02A2.6-like [Macrosteles quadrilineatus]